MKQTLKSFAFSALVLSFLSAPAFAAGMTEKGVKAGINMANLTGDDVSDNSNKMGFTVGGFGVWDMGNNLSVQIDALYTQKGAEFTGATLSQNYIDVPVMARYSMPVSGMNVNLLAGPYLGLLLSADYDGTDTKDTTTSMDYGLQFGASTIVQKQYLIDVRYSMGLVTIDDTSPAADVKHSGILITGGYLF